MASMRYGPSSSRDVPSSSGGAPVIPTPYEMSQYVDVTLTFVVPGIRHRTDRVSDFL